MSSITQRRMAASILKAGKGRVWMDPESMDEIGEAVTRNDIKKLINDGLIQAKQKQGISSFNHKKIATQKKKGRRVGHGKRKGKATARFPKKARWISTIRPIRAQLTELKKEGKMDASTYRKLYSMAKGGIFRSKAHLKQYATEHEMMKE